jgi:predicted nucleotidyltransferase
MSIDIRPDHLEIVISILKKYIPGRKVIAFGSRVTGTATQTSDLDLCILGEEGVSLLELTHLRDAFSLSMLPYKVDIVAWINLSTSFQAIIQKHFYNLT